MDGLSLLIQWPAQYSDLAIFLFPDGGKENFIPGCFGGGGGMMHFGDGQRFRKEAFPKRDCL